MGATRRKFTLEFKTEAAHRVIDTGRIDGRGGRRAVGRRTARWPGGCAMSAGGWKRWLDRPMSR